MSSPVVWIADSGGAGQILFTGASAPYPIPQPEFDYLCDVVEMREGAGGLGDRVAMLRGTTAHRGEIQFNVAYITPTNLTALYALYRANPPAPVQVSLDGGTSVYLCVFKGGSGLVVTNWTVDSTRQNVKIHLIILKKIT